MKMIESCMYRVPLFILLLDGGLLGVRTRKLGKRMEMTLTRYAMDEWRLKGYNLLLLLLLEMESSFSSLSQSSLNMKIDSPPDKKIPSHSAII